MNDFNKIKGTQVAFSNIWHDLPSYYSYDFLISSEFTQSRFRRVINQGKQIGLMLDIKLKRSCKSLSFEDLKTILTHTEKAFVNLVPNKLELNMLPDPQNTMWLLRPEARFNGQSQLQNCIHNPKKVDEILENIKEVPI